MPTPAGNQHTAEWVLNTPNPLNSVERLAGADRRGVLGCAYTTGVDTRWPEQTCLGPELLAINLSGAGGTAANAHMAVYVVKSSTEHFLYIIRGTVAAKYKIDNASVTGNGITLAGECTGIIVTENTDGTVMVSYAMEDDQATTYHNSTAIGTGANDTNSANNEGVKARFFLQAPNSRVIAMGGNGNKQLLQGNVLTGSVNMDASNYADISTIRGPSGIKETGGAIDDQGRIIIGTNYGPYTFNPETGAFRPVIQEQLTSPDDENCRGMRYSTLLGVHIPLRDGARWLKNDTTRSWGVKQFPNNTSPVWGPITAFTPTKDKWLFTGVRDEGGSDTYLVAWRPADDLDTHTERFTPFTIGKLASSAKCLFLEDVGFADGVLTNPMVIGGRDTNALSFLRALTAVPWDDSGYRYAASGTWFGTQMQRQELEVKQPVSFQFETLNCSATQTIQLFVQVDEDARIEVGAPVDSNGIQLIGPQNIPEELAGRRIVPSLDFVTGLSSSSPRVKGNLVMKYTKTPAVVDGQAIEEPR